MDIREDTRVFAKIKSLRMPLSSSLVSNIMTKAKKLENNYFSPQSPCLRKWNRIFLISCIFALALDPLFFYVYVIDTNNGCLDVDNRSKNIASFLRTTIDVFHIICIIKFHTAYTITSSRPFGREVLLADPSAVPQRHLSLCFFLDMLAILPIPQVLLYIIIPTLPGPSPAISKKSLRFVIYGQYVPRIARIYPLYKEVTRPSGLLHETTWAGVAFNLLLYMLASHVVGAFWYFFSINQKITCWQQACRKPECNSAFLYCNPAQKGNNTMFLHTACPLLEPDEIKNSKEFSFGIFIDALRSGMLESKDFSKKLFYCSWWGFRSLSSLGQNLQISASVGEIAFAFSIGISGLVLYSLLIGNMQKNLLSTKVTRADEMRAKWQDAERDAEQWMLRRMLPEDLKNRIRRYEQYKWQETTGVEEESLIRNLPKDLRRDIKRHLCLGLLKRVPMLAKMDKQLLDTICDHLKPVLYTEKSPIVHEGDLVDEMLFIKRGKLESTTTNGGRTGFFNAVYLKADDFCGEELLTWALDPNSSSSLPTSTRTITAIKDVEAFAFTAYDLKFVASQFQSLHSKQFLDTFRYYSQQWRTRAAYRIQVAWRQHCKRKHDTALHDAEDRLHDALAKDGGASSSLAATLYASRFTAKALMDLRKRGSPKTPQR